ncbi:WD40 repeat domain-containing protein [Streptomyces sp. A1499]|uniref:WD40 repeat domain-containing protein n=1 Tax=Streptomyces sp. A1499 TaxID=2563104 RepID=UPI00109E8D44|nr:WD40 repeat domain-containing protein [Streptomyces sp. A1499]THC40889.1 WD40 repeat domain-containing protein [Streptomyces sp. A1499]
MSPVEEDQQDPQQTDVDEGNQTDGERPERETIAGLILDRLTAPIREGGRPRWDLASPYLLRHATEHAAESGRLPSLFLDCEFLVHARPGPVLRFGAYLEGKAMEPVRALSLYRASLVEHITAEPHARRDVLAVDAARHQWPDLCQSFYHPRHAPPTLWQCRWSTASNVSFALRGTLVHDSPVESLATGTARGQYFAVTAARGDKAAGVWDLASGTRLRVLPGHVAPLTAVATSNSSSALVLTAAKDGTLRCCKPWSGETLWETTAHDGAVHGLQLHELHDVQAVITHGSDGTVGIRDLETGEIWRVFTGVPPGGRLVAAVGGMNDMVAYVGQRQLLSLDPATGMELFRKPLDFGEITGIAPALIDLSPVVVVTTADGVGQVWDLLDGKLASVFEGPPGAVNTLTTLDTSRGSVAVTGGKDGTIRLWDLERGGRPLRQLTGHLGAITDLAVYDAPARHKVDKPHSSFPGIQSVFHTPRVKPRITPDSEGLRRSELLDSLDGYALLSASADRTLREWSMADGSLRQTFSAHTDLPRTITVPHISGNPVAVSAGQDSTARVWALNDRRVRTAGRVTYPIPVSSVALSRVDGRLLIATGCGDERLRVVTASDGMSEGNHLNGTGRITAVGIGPTLEGPVAVIATDDGKLTARRPATGERLWQCTPCSTPDAPVTALAVGGSRRRPLVLSIDSLGGGRLRLHSLTGGRPTHHPLQGLPCVAVTTGRIGRKTVAAIAHHDGLIELWNLNPGARRRSLSGGSGDAVSVAIGTTPIGPMVAATYEDGRVRVWDADTGRRRCLLTSGPAQMTAIGTSHGRPVVVTADPSRTTLHFWDVETGDIHTVVTLPEAIGALSLTEGVLAVGYGRELAVFSASYDPGPWDDVKVPLAASSPLHEGDIEGTEENLEDIGGQMTPLELSVLLHVCQGGEPVGVSEVHAAFRWHFRRCVKRQLRSLLQKEYVCRAENPSLFLPTAEGRKAVAWAEHNGELAKRRRKIGSHCASCGI